MKETKLISPADVPPLPTSPCLALSLASQPMTGKNPQGRINLRQALVTEEALREGLGGAVAKGGDGPSPLGFEIA